MQAEEEQAKNETDEYMPNYSDEVMEAANRGERPITIMAPLDVKAKTVQKLDRASLRKRKVKKRGGKKQRRK